ncbi:MAG: hypothetical protein DMD91_33695 [Candidatus Rokuibacteriota bacterium]|nr:MAG: hypothetical protein DMD91_33695 [Candidatus Rokubacteria bacterium]
MAAAAPDSDRADLPGERPPRAQGIPAGRRRRSRGATAHGRRRRAVSRHPRRRSRTTVPRFLGRFTFGRGWRPGLGAYRILITNSFDVVWLQTTRGWVALSPERPEEFVARLRTRI